MRLVLFSIFATLACAFGKPPALAKHVPTLDGRIVGGSPVDITQHPYQISLMYFTYHSCGGSIISPKWILSAAHCVIDTSIDSFKIRAGSSTSESGGIIRSLNSIYYHADYSKVTQDYDISALELTSKLTYSASIQPVELPYLNQQISTGTLLTVTGWGKTSEGGTDSNQLLAVELPVVSTSVCAASFNSGGNRITERMLCAGYPEGGKDACQNDSGGPLTRNNVLWGIVSWGSGCARPNLYGVYAHVPNLRNWITQVTKV